LRKYHLHKAGSEAEVVLLRLDLLPFRQQLIGRTYLALKFQGLAYVEFKNLFPLLDTASDVQGDSKSHGQTQEVVGQIIWSRKCKYIIVQFIALIA
jgi:hypothetical protein